MFVDKSTLTAPRKKKGLKEEMSAVTFSDMCEEERLDGRNSWHQDQPPERQ